MLTDVLAIVKPPENGQMFLVRGVSLSPTHRFQRHTRFGRESLFRVVEEDGFRILYFQTCLVKPFTDDQMEKLLKHGIIDPKIIEPLGNDDQVPSGDRL